MSQKTKKQRDPPPALCGRNGGKSESGKRLPFITIYADLMQESEFTDLPSGARMLYLCMMLEAKQNTDRFEFPASIAERYGFKGHTLRNCLKKLEEAGFIKCLECNRTLRTANVYAHSQDWKFRPAKAPAPSNQKSSPHG